MVRQYAIANYRQIAVACKWTIIWNDIPAVLKSAKALHLFINPWKTYVAYKIIRAINGGG